MKVGCALVTQDRECDMVQLLLGLTVRGWSTGLSLDVSGAGGCGVVSGSGKVRCWDTEVIALQAPVKLIVDVAVGSWRQRRSVRDARFGPTIWRSSYRARRPVGLIRVVMAMWRGSSVGGIGIQHEDNFVIVIGAQTLHAVGYAMGVVRDGAVATGDADRDTAVLVFLGDGAMSQGDVSEAFGWAAAQHLPVVFFCQNNHWAISAPVQTQSRVPLYQRAAGFGFPGLRVDGNDVLATLEVTRRALDDARRGRGPTLIEAFTYRMNPHTTSDDSRRYRTQGELDSWAVRDPITRVRAYLDRTGAVDGDFYAALANDAEKLAFKIRAGGRSLPDASPTDLFDHTYIDMPPELAAQRAELDALMARELQN